MLIWKPKSARCKSFFYGFILSFTLLNGFSGWSQKVNFSGKWILKDQHRISGNLYDNGVPKQMNIIQESDSMIIERVTMNQNQKDVRSVETIRFDGKLNNTVTPSKRKKTVMIKWSNDGQDFVETSIYNSAVDESKVDFKITDTWTLSNNGKTLTMMRVNESNIGESWASKAIYDKRQ
jgi:hypothetical protein